jgi:prepilin-type processing-associated H-X9-DG protein
MSRAAALSYRRTAYSIPELLVVLGIIGVLLAFTMSVVVCAQHRARDIACRSNLRGLGVMLQAYQNENDGWLYPVVVSSRSGMAHGRGTRYPPHLRWPAFVFELSGAPLIPPYDPADYTSTPYMPEKFPAELYTPAVLRCPSDDDPADAHSYVLNDHLGRQAWKAGTRSPFAVPASEIIVAGEKKSKARDYMMNATGDFDLIIEEHRHHPIRCGNFLYLDGHAGDAATSPAEGPGIDPWDPGPR